jgi:hypothetical protein
LVLATSTPLNISGCINISNANIIYNISNLSYVPQNSDGTYSIDLFASNPCAEGSFKGVEVNLDPESAECKSTQVIASNSVLSLSFQIIDKCAVNEAAPGGLDLCPVIAAFIAKLFVLL